MRDSLGGARRLPQTPAFMSPRKPRRLTQDIHQGLKWGLAFGFAYAVLGTVMVAVRGSAMLRQYDLSWAGLVAGYIGGGAAAGMIVGALLPLTRRPIGLAFVGFVAALPFTLYAVLAMTAPEDWGRFLPVVPLFAAIAGPGCAFAVKLGLNG